MTWLAWRRQRAALLLAAGLVVLAVVVLVVARLALAARAASLGVPACLTDPGLVCSEGEPGRTLYLGFRDVDGDLQRGLFLVFPALGLLLGAGLFAREFEQHTDVFALTQGVSLRRWWATGVSTCLLPAVAGALVVTAVAAWARRPYTVLYHHDRLGFDFFLSAAAPAAAALLAFALAAGAGLLVRNSLATVLVTVVGWTVLLVVALVGYLDVLPDRIVTGPLDPAGGLTVTSPAGAVPRDYGYLDAAGHRLDLGTIFRLCSDQDDDTCARASGAVVQYQTYQPDSHYRPLQLILAGAAVLIAALLLGAGLWRVVRR